MVQKKEKNTVTEFKKKTNNEDKSSNDTRIMLPRRDSPLGHCFSLYQVCLQGDSFCRTSLCIPFQELSNIGHTFPV